MLINYTGYDGYYEIYNPTYIVHRKLNYLGEQIFYREYKSIEEIPNTEDRDRIFEKLFGRGECLKEI